MRRLALALPLAVSGCGSAPLPVHVPVPCIQTMPDRASVYADGEIASMPDGRLVQALHADRLAWRAYARELEAAAAPCALRPAMTSAQ